MKTKQNPNKIWIFGLHPVLNALTNRKRQFFKLLISRHLFDKHQELFSTLKKLEIKIVENKEFEHLFPMDANHQNIALECSPLPGVSLLDICETSENLEKSCILILDQIQDPHNLGAIMRSAAAFGATAVIVPENNAAKETATAVKVAAGGFEVVPFVSVTNLVNSITTLKNHGYWIIALDGYAQNTLSNIELPNKCAIVIGSEGKGVRPLTMKNSDIHAKIDISSKMESLNASNAAAIALYEFNRK